MKNVKHKERNVWVIRAGKKGEAHALFVNNGFICLDDPSMGDLRLLPKDRPSFYKHYRSSHTEESNVSVGGIGGKFFRFSIEVQIGDRVLYPCLLDQNIYLGEITSAYFYDRSCDIRFPHRRRIKWLETIPKSTLSEFAKRELGAARTFFRFKSHIAEIEKYLGPGLQRKSVKKTSRLVNKPMRARNH